MVYLGHPKFVGYNDSTLTSLEQLISEVQKDNTWLTTLYEVADFRKNLSSLQFYAGYDKNTVHIDVVAPENITVNDVCLNFRGTVKDASVKKGKVRIINKSQDSRVLFEAFNGQSLTIRLE
jgi:hypothetical protein